MGEVNMIDVDLAKYTLEIMATLSVQQKEKTFTSCDLYIGRADTRLLQRARHMAVPGAARRWPAPQPDRLGPQPTRGNCIELYAAKQIPAGHG